MKRYIKSDSNPYAWKHKFDDSFTQEDIDLWESIDWKARNYEDFIVEDDTFEGRAVVYGLGKPQYIPTTFVKHIPPNPIYGVSYSPVDKDIAKKTFPGNSIVGPMYDGRTHNGYNVHDRYETYALYDQLSR